MMTYHPIPFNPFMVRAIIGNRKSQTRLVIKPQPERHECPTPLWTHPLCQGYVGATGDPLDAEELAACCPFQPGDILWVRETCRAEELESGLDGVRYMADNAFLPIENIPEASDLWGLMYCYRYQSERGQNKRGLIVPSIHMPKWAARLFLGVTDVRVQRVQDISEEDAKAEGVEIIKHRGADGAPLYRCYQGTSDFYLTALKSYMSFWDSINAKRQGGAYAWSSNPWVWVVSFSRTEKPERWAR
jgi:hypothetical protein